jgi:ABC-type branched-subunit amino acid transport system substrate-binding protein
MQKIVLVVVTLFALSGHYSVAQELTTAERVTRAVTLISDEQIDAAWEMLSGIDTPQATLLKAKVLLKRGEFEDVVLRLQPIINDPLPALAEEALYTTSLAQFYNRSFTDVLENCTLLRENSRTSGMRREAEQLYETTLTWISSKQATEIIRNTSEFRIKRDVIHAQVRKLDFDESQDFFATHRSVIASADVSLLRDIENALSSESRHRAYARTFVPREPSAVIYNLGVVLPDVGARNELYPVSRSLYTGIQNAIDVFNLQNANKEFKLNWYKLDQNKIDASDIREWAETNHIDIIIGPILSESAREIAIALEPTGIPILAPLANDPDLTDASPHLYQLNPGADERGYSIATFAIETLRFRSFAIITDKSEIATRETEAFRARIEEMGGRIEYTFDGNYLTNPDLLDKEFLVLSSDPFVIDSLEARQVDAIYTAIGSEEGETLFNIITTSLDAVASRVAIIGTQDLNIINIASRVKRDFNVYTYSPYDENPIGSLVMAFSSEFRAYTDASPNLFGFLGYDSATFVTRLADRYSNPSQWNSSIVGAPAFRGLSLPISFNRNRINQRLFFYRLSDTGKMQLGD